MGSTPTEIRHPKVAPVLSQPPLSLLLTGTRVVAQLSRSDDPLGDAPSARLHVDTRGTPSGHSGYRKSLRKGSTDPLQMACKVFPTPSHSFLLEEVQGMYLSGGGVWSHVSTIFQSRVVPNPNMVPGTFPP